MTKRLMLLGAATAALAVPASATAGGWATVSLDSLPDGVAPAQPWVVELTILQHGVTPLEGVNPRVTVIGHGGRSREAFAARPTGEAGVYRASVTFPEPGTWRYVVWDGFSAQHTYPPVRIGDGGTAATGAPAATSGAAGGEGAGGDGPNIALALLAAVVAGLAAGLTTATRRRRREGPAAAGG
jgi:hypothetical protein